MSFDLRDECHICFGLTGWVGKMMGGEHRCKCEDAEAIEQPEEAPLTEVKGDPFLKRRAA